MTKTVKVVLMIVVFFVGIFLSAIFSELMGNSKSVGPFGLFFLLAIGATMRAIWKYKPEDDKDKKSSADNQGLNKF